MTDILFIHPDLGIGGAEKLVVDAAVALSKKGYTVRFLTNHHDEQHCFNETKSGNIPVTVVGDWLPRHVFGKLYALCAYLRFFYLTLYLILFMKPKPDVVFCDLISATIPLLKRLNYKVIFYCHYPDLLLSKPGGFLKKLYRYPLNSVEEYSIAKADKILVNSKFTLSVVLKTFPTLQNSDITVLYPSINTDVFNLSNEMTLKDVIGEEKYYVNVFLSINRFERKKNLELAVRSMIYLKEQIDQETWNKTCLVIAGGYDNRVSENVSYFSDLINETERLHLSQNIVFLKSPSEAAKVTLLRFCKCVLYTPSNEHFGIVPLEAMFVGKPVIAVNSGGPLETVVHDHTGYLSDPDAKQFAFYMAKILADENRAEQMGLEGKARFLEQFSFHSFQEKLHALLLLNLIDSLVNSFS